MIPFAPIRTEILYPALARRRSPGLTAAAALRAQDEAAGLHMHPRTAVPSWTGERLDLTYAIDVLYPRGEPPTSAEPPSPEAPPRVEEPRVKEPPRLS